MTSIQPGPPNIFSLSLSLHLHLRLNLINHQQLPIIIVYQELACQASVIGCNFLIMPEPYYNYTTNPVTTNDPYATGHWENPDDWPKTFNYVAKFGLQGLHPPAPVYQTNQPAQPAMYTYFAVCLTCSLTIPSLIPRQGNPTSPAGYHANGVYYGTTTPAAPVAGWPYTSSSYYPYYPTSTFPLTYYNHSYNYPYKYSPYYTAPAQPFLFPTAAPSPWSPWGATTATAQAAAAVAANAALAQAPTAPYYFVGSTAADIQAQNAILAAQFMTAGQSVVPPNQLVPYKPGNTPQFWCKELDGSWTLRELSDFTTGDLAAGRWEVHPTSGYRYFVKHPT